MTKKYVVITIILGILLSVGCAIKYNFCTETPSVQSPEKEPVNATQPANSKIPDSVKDKELTSNEPSPRKPTLNNQSIDKKNKLVDKSVKNDDKPDDLSEHTMSMKREENKGYEVMPGVNVKSGGINVQLDDDNTRSIELKRSPSSSNSDYQLMMKKKF